MVQKMNPQMRPAGYSEAQRVSLTTQGRETGVIVSCNGDGACEVTTPQGRPTGPRTNARSIKGK